MQAYFHEHTNILKKFKKNFVPQVSLIRQNSVDAFTAASSDEFDGLMLKVISTPDKENKAIAKPEHETVHEEDEKKE